jgi:hypothetical protein
MVNHTAAVIIMTTHNATILYFLAIIGYYLRRGTFTPIAFLFNKSFTVNHPDHLFPIIISPSWNHTIHSFYPDIKIKAYIKDKFSLPPTERHWWDSKRFEERLKTEIPIPRAIVLDGNLSGPLLRQGIMFIQDSNIIFIGEEVGRYPRREDYLTTIHWGQGVMNLVGKW